MFLSRPRRQLAVQGVMRLTSLPGGHLTYRMDMPCRFHRNEKGFKKICNNSKRKQCGNLKTLKQVIPILNVMPILLLNAILVYTLKMCTLTLFKKPRCVLKMSSFK